MKLELLTLAILLLAGLFIILPTLLKSSPSIPFNPSQQQPKNQEDASNNYNLPNNITRGYPSFPNDRVIGGYPSQSYFPQSLGMSGNTYLDYVNSKYYGYYPGYNYTYDPYVYNWNGNGNIPENINKSINIENKPYISINTKSPITRRASPGVHNIPRQEPRISHFPSPTLSA